MHLKSFATSALLAASIATVSSAISPTAANAYARHEHPFYNLSSANNDQAKANRLCLQILNQRLSILPFSQALNGTWLIRGRVWHVWAHLNNRQCIANQ